MHKTKVNREEDQLIEQAELNDPTYRKEVINETLVENALKCVQSKIKHKERQNDERN